MCAAAALDVVLIAAGLLLVAAHVRGEDVDVDARRSSLASSSSAAITGGAEWKIVFYTGDGVWAGTDSDLYIELIGDYANSKVTMLRPSRGQMEARSVDTFSLGDLDGRHIGQLKQLIVGKQYSYALFNDWQLKKVEVFDPLGKKYLFSCNCWFTSNNFKRIINLSAVEGAPNASGSLGSTNAGYADSFSLSSRSSRTFPMTLGLLFFFFMLVSFTYFGKIFCNKWRDHLIYFTSLTSNDPRRVVTSTHRNGQRRTPPRRHGHGHGYVNGAGGLVRAPGVRSSTGEDTTLNQTSYFGGNPAGAGPGMSAVMVHRNEVTHTEDKPPEYLELFPMSHTSANKAAAAVLVVDPPPTVGDTPLYENATLLVTNGNRQPSPPATITTALPTTATNDTDGQDQRSNSVMRQTVHSNNQPASS